MRKAKMSAPDSDGGRRSYRTVGRVLKHANTRSGTPLTTDSPFDEPLRSIAFVDQVTAVVYFFQGLRASTSELHA